MMRTLLNWRAMAPQLHRIGALYRVEIAKTMRLRQTYAGPVLVALLVLLSPLVQPLAKDDLPDYAFVAYVTPLALNFLGYILLLVYVGGLIATEVDRGTLRAILLRPVRREEVYLAKLALGFTYSALLTLTAGVTSWTLAALFGDLHGIQVGGELLHTSDDMAMAYLGGALLALAPQWAGVSLGLLYSTISRSATTAISLSVGTWILLDLFKYPLGIGGAVFTTYLEAPWRVFADYCDGLDGAWMPMVFYCLASSLAVIIPATALGLAVFKRRNLGAC